MNEFPTTIWALRCDIDDLYQAAIAKNGGNVDLHIAYALSLWRIGYNADGITTLWDGKSGSKLSQRASLASVALELGTHF